jgi:hypothetical protein
MQRFFIEGTNCCTFCDCIMSFECFRFIYCTKRLVFSLTCRDLFVEGTDCCALGDYIWLGNILHILFYIFAIILREFCVVDIIEVKDKFID